MEYTQHRGEGFSKKLCFLNGKDEIKVWKKARGYDHLSSSCFPPAPWLLWHWRSSQCWREALLPSWGGGTSCDIHVPKHLPWMTHGPNTKWKQLSNIINSKPKAVCHWLACLQASLWIICIDSNTHQKPLCNSCILQTTPASCRQDTYMATLKIKVSLLAFVSDIKLKSNSTSCHWPQVEWRGNTPQFKLWEIPINKLFGSPQFKLIAIM